MGVWLHSKLELHLLSTVPSNENVNMVFNQVSGDYYADGTYYNPSTGVFVAPQIGIYSFSFFLNLPASGSLILKVTGKSNETIVGPTTSTGNYRETIIMKLNENDEVNVAVIQTNPYSIPFEFIGYFTGFRVY